MAPFPSRKQYAVSILALCLLVPVEAVFAPPSAQAQTFIETILKRDARKAPLQRKRPAVKRLAPRPVTRPATKPETRPRLPLAVPLPAPRPEQTGKDQPASAVAHPPEKPALPEPAKPDQDERVYQVACPVLLSGEVEGKLLPPIEDSAQCGVHSPLSLTAIGNDEPLKFDGPVTTNCAMAVTLAQWSKDVKDAAREIYGSGMTIIGIGTGSDYQCRKVNGISAGRVSEHAFANALDIMSFAFSDGSKTELTRGWDGSEKEKAFWRAVHGASCKLFMTVIGPDGDAAHRTNMHLDQGCHGQSCLARICE